MNGVRAVLFDVFGTLVDWRTSIALALERYGLERDLACDWFAFADAWRAAYVPAMNRVRGGEIAWHNLDALHEGSLNGIVRRFDLPALSDTDRAWFVRRWHELEPWPDSRAGLARLRDLAIVGTLSNGNVALQVDLLRYARLPVDVIFSAEHFRHYKPDPQTYLGAVALLGLEPHQVALAAAHNDDLKAAAKLGLRTAFVHRPTEYGPKQSTDLRPDAAYDAIVRNTVELAALFEY